MGQTQTIGGHDSQWWKDYGKAFANGVNPMVSIRQGMDAHMEQDFPPPQIPTAPVPQRWWHPEESAHPLYSVPQGAPQDFGGTVIPNPDGRRPMADTQSPADQITDAKMSADNFYGRPKGDISNPRVRKPAPQLREF